MAGLRFRDLNRNGQLDPYEDWRLTPAARARDLVSQMTLEEKAGAMMHGTARSGGPMGGAGVGTAYDTAANRALIDGAKVNSMITRLGGDPATLAAQDNALQQLAEGTRLGIPLTISTDPRHHFQYVLGATVTAGKFSQWPEALGLAAIGDAALVRRFGDIARQEYRAVGIQMALSPQADLSTEPRWARTPGTFGEDAALAGTDGPRVRRGIPARRERRGLGRRGDDREALGRLRRGEAGARWPQPLWPLRRVHRQQPRVPRAAVRRRVRRPTSPASCRRTTSSRARRGGASRSSRWAPASTSSSSPTSCAAQYGFKGIVLTDWAVTNDCNEKCINGAPKGERPSFADIGMPWGVESLPKRERFVKAVQAGVDQFGGTEDAKVLVEAVRKRRDLPRRGSTSRCDGS